MRSAIALTIVFAAIADKVFACGPFFPNNLLDAGDNGVLQAPVADFERELERMKLVATSVAVPVPTGQSYSEQSGEKELEDLTAALKQANVSTEEAARIVTAHQVERGKLEGYVKQWDDWSSYREWIYDTNGAPHLIGSTNPPPVFPEIIVTPGLPGEFANYFEGAIAWHKGDVEAARAEWERLLKLPAAERKYKSTWAAYMLGMAWMADTNDITGAGGDQAMGYFRQVRKLAHDGFNDSVGLVTASIGREAQIQLRRKNYGEAMELYLEQYAAGDETAVMSLRRTVGVSLEEHGATKAQLEVLAKNSRTRQVIMAYLVSRNPYDDRSEIGTDPDAKAFFDRTDNWLNTVEAAGVRDVESAEELALAAYQAGNMAAAQRWIDRADDSTVAQWLQAKLDLRAGKIDAAAVLLAKVSREFPQQLPDTNAPADFAQSLFVDINPVWGDRLAVGNEAQGELGAVYLARREYTEALDALLHSDYWPDAAYVAERVLTVDELKTYVDRAWPAVTAEEAAKESVDKSDVDVGPSNVRQQIRDLLARRLARSERYDEAREYFPSNEQAELDELVSALRSARDESKPRDERAGALFEAAWMTRTNGMELYGTETEPDGAGVSIVSRTNEAFKVLPATAEELERARQHAPEPDARYHYRYQAAALAFEAAKLMPDNSNETAQVLCTGGSWIKYLDPQRADPIYKALVRHCRKTAIGRQADLMRWFPDLDEVGNPIPYRPRIKQAPGKLELDSIQMFDRSNGWAQSARAVFRTNDWQFDDKAILSTTNGGETWTCRLRADKTDEMFPFFCDAQTARVAAVFDESSNVTILRTTDGGGSWVHADFCQVSYIDECRLSFPDTHRGWPYEGWLMVIPDHGMNSSPGDLYYSNDGGEDWQLVNSTRNDPHTEDSWEEATEPDFTNAHPYLTCGGMIAFQNATNGWLRGSMASTTPAFLFRTEDGGGTWLVKALSAPALLHDGDIEPLEVPHFYPADGVNGILGAMFCPTNGMATNYCTVIYSTLDGGETWQPGTPVKFRGIWDFISARTGWMWSPEPHNSNSTAPVKGTLFRTGDGGGTWEPVSAEKGLGNYLTHGEDIVQLDFVDEDCGWAIVRNRHNVAQLLRTTDGGRTWNELEMKVGR